MTPSEHRLHPASILFALSGSLKAFALPALLFVLSSMRSGTSSPTPSILPWTPFGRAGRWAADLEVETWHLWLVFFFAMAVVTAIIRYVTFRVRYEGAELVIRSGLIFRNERHVPYARIQNLDATRNVLHRLLGVAEVRVDTGGGSEPEARISVLHETVFEEMRRRIFEGRVRTRLEAPAVDQPAEAAPAVEPQTLLHLPPRELLLLGLLDNRGMLLVAALYGVLWETGLQGWVWERLTSGLYAPGMLSDTLDRLSRGQIPPLWQFGVMGAGLLALLVLVRLLSMIWVSVTLHDYRLTRLGGDLRTEYGLLTRVTSTIPLRRVQTLTIRDTPLYRLLGRATLRVTTAGGTTANPQQGMKRPRERLAPIIRTSAVAGLVSEMLPHGDLATLEWQPVHPRAYRRATKSMLLLSGLPILIMLPLVGWRLWPLMVLVIGFSLAYGRMHVKHMAWAADDHRVAFRSGWLWRRTTIAPAAKIQVLTTSESPFDRRAGMAGVSIDTAGGLEATMSLRIPYLARETAQALLARLSTRAAETSFRW